MDLRKRKGAFSSHDQEVFFDIVVFILKCHEVDNLSIPAEVY
jgi:hypothetical protein